MVNLADQWKAAIFALVTKAPVRLGFEFEKRQNSKFWQKCHNIIVPTAEHGQLHTVEQNLSILAPLNVPIISDVTMAYSHQDKQWLEETIKSIISLKTILLFNQPLVGFLNVGMKIKWLH